jgi:adenylyl-sulfate kinase
MKYRFFVIWFSGLSGSGKTTLSTNLCQELCKYGYKLKVLDGDILRGGLNRDLGFALKDRNENIRRAAEINKLFLEEEFIVINSFITPMESMRDMAKDIIGEENFFHIYLNTPLKVCIERDPKGLYTLCKNGKIEDMTGIQSAFEPCNNADIVLDTSGISISSCIDRIIISLQERFNFSKCNGWAQTLKI